LSQSERRSCQRNQNRKYERHAFLRIHFCNLLNAEM
jgi:hypothetical protein